VNLLRATGTWISSLGGVERRECVAQSSATSSSSSSQASASGTKEFKSHR
jgi:hypothetical protein